MLFFSEKNPTPNQLSFFTAINNATVILVLTVLAKLLFAESISWALVFALPLATLLFGYLTMNYSLKHFIYRKIKLIYKTIHSLKASKNTPSIKVDMNTHMIDRVEQEVKNWASNWRKEITDLKSMEEYRREFLGNVSHELKTPIFNIQGYLDTLIEGGIHDESINIKYLKRAVDNTERMANIVSDLGYISKFEAGKLQLNLMEFDITQIVQEVLDDMELKAHKKNIQLEFKEDKLKPILVIADKESIQRVLINLISNSIKYGKENGRTRVGFYDMEENVLIEMSDDGKGIAQEHIPRLFERFYRVDKGRSRAAGGTGLGLAIVKHILEAHNQTINVRSSVGVGSTFGFTLKKA